MTIQTATMHQPGTGMRKPIPAASGKHGMQLPDHGIL
jgi:hypothetical protein